MKTNIFEGRISIIAKFWLDHVWGGFEKKLRWTSVRSPFHLHSHSVLIFFKRIRRKRDTYKTRSSAPCRIRALQTLQSQRPWIALERELEGIDFRTYSRTSPHHLSPNHLSDTSLLCCQVRLLFFSFDVRKASKILRFPYLVPL